MVFAFFGDKMNRLANWAYIPKASTCLMLSVASLMFMSLLMVASASIPFAIKSNSPELSYFWSQFKYMAVAILCASIIYQIPLKFLYSIKTLVALIITLIGLLVLTLLIADPINGSKRWLSVGGVNFQSAEFAKFLMVLVVAEYVHRRSYEVRHSVKSMFRLAVWYVPTVLLLFFQPDFGSIVMLLGVLVMMFWAAGVPLTSYIVVLIALGFMGTFWLLQADYRQERLQSFIDPFDDILDSDYQLARSLAAIGRGEFNGVGYSNSVFKLNHLPEAHTDFLLAVTGEEFGFLGISFVLFLEFVVVASIMRISYNALVRHQAKLSYTCFGFAVLIFGQILINAGMNLGMMPVKGLTMPFFSYGGSAMLFFVMMLAVVLKIDKESPVIYANHQSRDY